jgi:DNA-binding response OmpR family regulator
MNADAKPAPRILLVDDDAGIRQMLGIALEDEGYSVIAAESGNQALALLEEHPVDLIISDVRMPDGDGAYLLDTVRKRSELPLFILMSGFTDITEEDALQRGADAFFHKPYRLEELLDAIESRLGEASAAE